MTTQLHIGNFADLILSHPLTVRGKINRTGGDGPAELHFYVQVSAHLAGEVTYTYCPGELHGREFNVRMRHWGPASNSHRFDDILWIWMTNPHWDTPDPEVITSGRRLLGLDSSHVLVQLSRAEVEIRHSRMSGISWVDADEQKHVFGTVEDRLHGLIRRLSR